MSRRESTVKSIAGGLQPKGFDLTTLARARVASRVRDPMKLRGEDAAGALAFASGDRVIEGEETYGAPLEGLLLRLKYADQFSKVLFKRAHELLLDRHGGLATKKSETMSAVAFVALFEWVHDGCPECRSRRGVQRPRPCPACPPFRREEVELGRDERDRQGKRLANVASKIGPNPGCPKCGGLGRSFRPEKRAKGVRCVACHNSGRLELKRKARWALVNGHLGDLQEASGQLRRGIDYDSFRTHWQDRYYRFLDVLRAADQNLAAGVDLGLTASHNRGRPIQEEHSVELEPSDFDDPEELTGGLPPAES